MIRTSSNQITVTATANRKLGCVNIWTFNAARSLTKTYGVWMDDQGQISRRTHEVDRLPRLVRAAALAAWQGED